jgi:NAD dependent epimerase/dehydratase
LWICKARATQLFMTLKHRKVLVTGAGGFIGSHLCEALLQEGAEVTAMVRYTSRAGGGDLALVAPELRPHLQIVAGDISDPHFMRRVVTGQDTVFHLAALIAIPYSYLAPLSYIRTNVEGTTNVLEAARQTGVRRVLHTSTSEVYGTARYTPIDELHPLQGQSPYSASKIGADKVAESYYRSFGTPVVTVRPFNTYGPRQSARAVIPTIISQALTQPQVTLGSLTPVRDLTYVTDTVAGFLQAAVAEQVEGEVINLGTGRAVTIGDLAKLIFELMGVQPEIVTAGERLRPEKSEVMMLLSENAKAAASLGWQPAVSLEDGLRKTIAFVRAWPDRFAPGVYTV